jgi:hypothetical protein
MPLLGGSGSDPCDLPSDSVTGEPSLSRNEESNVSISLSTVVLSAEPLEERTVPMGQPERIPAVVGYADDEGEEDDEDVDDLDDDEDEDDEELDEDLDYDWEEVVDDDEEDDEEDEDDE